MKRFVIRRLVSTVLVLFAISVATFAIFAVIPGGDPAVRMAGQSAGEREREQIREDFGLDRPLPVQYVRLMGQVFSGQLISYSSQRNVLGQISAGLPRTLSLALGAAVIWMVLAVLLGVYSATRAGRVSERVLTALSLVGVSMPVFWVGALMSQYLGFELGLFPTGGYVPLTEDPVGWAYHLVLPWTALSLLFVGIYSRVLRSNMLDALEQEHVLGARARGLPERTVLRRHVLRNSLIPVVSLWGLDLGAVLGGGAILTETVFDLRGVGQYAAESVDALDQPPVIAITLLGAFAIVVLNALVDVVYAYLDPRVRSA